MSDGILNFSTDFIQSDVGQAFGVIALVVLAYRFVVFLINFFDRKVPALDVKNGILRHIVDGPRSVLTAGIISVLFGVLLINSSFATNSLFYKLLGILLTEFGFAFFIAFVLHITIEMQARSEHDKQLSRGIISYIYGVRLDEKMFLAAEEHIFRSAFYRKNMRVEYEFKQRKNGKILVKYTCEYDVYNISNKDDDFTISTFVEKSTDFCGSENVFGRQLGLYRISIDGQPLTQSDVDKARGTDRDDDNFITSSYPIPLKSGQSAHIVSVSLVEKCDRDGELWRSVYPADGLTVRICWPEAMALDVKAEVVHPSESFDTPPHIESGLLEAKLSKPLFPQNGIFLWWGPLPETADLEKNTVNRVVKPI